MQPSNASVRFHTWFLLPLLILGVASDLRMPHNPLRYNNKGTGELFIHLTKTNPTLLCHNLVLYFRAHTSVVINILPGHSVSASSVLSPGKSSFHQEQEGAHTKMPPSHSQSYINQNTICAALVCLLPKSKPMPMHIHSKQIKSNPPQPISNNDLNDAKAKVHAVHPNMN